MKIESLATTTPLSFAEESGIQGSPEETFTPENKKRFYQKLLEGFALDIIKQMQNHDAAMKRAMRGK